MTSRNKINAASAANGHRAIKTPSAVATPLPPLNLSHTGKQWPSRRGHARKDHGAGRIVGKSRRQPNRHRAFGGVQKQGENSGRWARPRGRRWSRRCCRCRVPAHLFHRRVSRKSGRTEWNREDTRRARAARLPREIPAIERYVSVTKGNDCTVVYSAPVDLSLLSMR